MEERNSKRLTTALLPVEIAVLGDQGRRTQGRLIDASSNGLRIGVTDSIPVGSFLRIEFEDSAILGEVRYCDDERSWYAVGLYVEEVILGKSPVSQLMERLMNEDSSSQTIH